MGGGLESIELLVPALLLGLLGGLPLIAWCVVGRRPAPAWVLLGPLALVAATNTRFGVALALITPLALAAAFAAWVRPMAPDEPVHQAAGGGGAALGWVLAPFAASSVALTAVQAATHTWGHTPYPFAMWLVTAAAAVARTRAGGVAAATARTLGIAAVLGAIDPLLHLADPVELLVVGVATALHGVGAWVAVGRPWTRLASGALALAVVPWCADQLHQQGPAVGIELVARARGAWDTLPRAPVVTPVGACAPVAFGDPPVFPCVGGGARLAAADDRLEALPGGLPIPAFAVRGEAWWPPSSRAGVVRVEQAYRLWGDATIHHGTVSLVGAGPTPIADLGTTAWLVVQPDADATYGDVAAVCSQGRCSQPGRRLDWSSSVAEVVWGSLRGIAVAALLAALVRRAVHDAGGIPNGWWALLAWIAGLVWASARPESLLVVPLGVAIGIAWGSRALAPRDRPARIGALPWLGVPLLVLPFVPAVPDIVIFGGAAWAGGFAPYLLAGRPAAAATRARLAVLLAVPLGLFAALLGAEGWVGLGVQIDAVAFAFVLPAAIGAARARRWWDAGAAVVACAGLTAGAGYALVPSDAERALDALDDGQFPEVREPTWRGVDWDPDPCVFHGDPLNGTTLVSQRGCSGPRVAIVAKGRPATDLLALPSTVELLAARATGWEPRSRSLVRFVWWDPADDPLNVRFLHGTVDAFVDACAPEGSCLVAAPGLAGVPTQ